MEIETSQLFPTCKLDVDPRRDDDAPMSPRFMLNLLERYQVFGTSQNKSLIQFENFLKKESNFWDCMV